MDRDLLRLELLKLTLRGAATAATAMSEVEAIEARLFKQDKPKEPLTLNKK